MPQLTTFWQTIIGKFVILGGGLVVLLSLGLGCAICGVLFAGGGDWPAVARSETTPPVVSPAAQPFDPAPAATSVLPLLPSPSPAQTEPPTPTATRVVLDTPTPSPGPAIFAPTLAPATEVAPAATPAPPQVAPNQQEAFVLHVFDGDTIDVAIGSVEYRVHYLLINAPDKGDEPFGPEAHQVNKALVEGRNVLLERDVSHADQYGQLLRYVYVDGLLVNEDLLRRGLAQVVASPPNERYMARFLAAQQEAQNAGVGIWASQ